MLGHEDTSPPERGFRSGDAARDREPRAHRTRHTRGRLDWPTILRNIALGLAVLAAVWAVFNVRLPSIDVLQDDIAAAGFWGFGVFILIYAVVAATPIPVTIMAVAARAADRLVHDGGAR